jgi:ABC-type transport system involved in multi-copper enzyme maturation permease subunit
MVFEVIFKELRENFHTVRFYLILVLTIALFTVSGIIFSSNSKQKIADYRSRLSENESLLSKGSKNLCGLAGSKQNMLKRTNPLEFLSEANEKNLPNKFQADIYVLDFPEVEGQTNLLLREFSYIDWEFIVGIVLSFLAFVIGYDAVCGEKEQKTLSLIFSNSVKTSHVFLGKFLGLLISLSIPFLIGSMISLLITELCKNMSVEYGKVAIFVCVSLVYLSLFILIGMTVSSIFSQSITSAVTLLFIWILSAFIIPASGNLIAHNVYPIPNRAEIQKKMGRTQNELWERYSKTDKNAFRWEGNPFKPYVPIRDRYLREWLNIRNQIFDDYLNQMVQQVEKTRSVTKISPVSIFRSLVEEIAGTGVNRFRNFYEQVNRYREQLYSFVETKDKLDPKSPHLVPLVYEMHTGISELPVEFSSIPKFEERLPSIKDNLKRIMVDSAVLIFLSILFFYLGYFLFVRYDKR